jgi:hypothetical protein
VRKMPAPMSHYTGRSEEAALTYGMEFHDSQLLDLQHDADGNGFALFHACVFRSQGQVFQDDQESGWQNVRFILHGIRVANEPFELGEYVSDGEFFMNGVAEGGGVMSLPADHQGELRFELMQAPAFGTQSIRFQRIQSAFEGEFELEAVWDKDGNRTGV